MTNNKQYIVLAYSGLIWLRSLGMFDSFDEAQDALSAEFYRQADSMTEDSPEDIRAFDETFWSISRIVEY